jgi:oxygen-independent coproporphyrinogen-3 oxidase
MLKFHEALPLSLYIHLPWCVKKCPYCDFNSHAASGEPLPEAEYVAALVRDLEFALAQIWGRRITSIFIGGGTPSLFSGAAINELLAALHARLNFNPAIEITLEANPGTTDSEHFHGYYAAGVNRLSIGVQSFNDDHLRALGRIHDAAAARRAIDAASAAGFDNINLDLMFGLPGQTTESAIRDLEIAIECAPQHISWYQLTIEPNTAFYSRPPALPDEDRVCEMQEYGQVLLAQHGYEHYEVSAYATTGRRCRHNLNYWEFGDYLGIGAGAHSKLTDAGSHCVRRHARHRMPLSYLQLAGTDAAVVSGQTLSKADLVLEFMLNALRLVHGFAPDLFTQRCGIPLEEISVPLGEAQARQLLERDINKIIPTARGRRYLNDLIACFMQDQETAV